ncbi:MAG: PfaD family polyunsaturated fatty acid/polyketide biosynthesis protein [Proteobacteria bacterium]|nr:PfaD family polyunsaturated fatty acid/polyketide biosynthesis protein [Pseudomonadota bacterium]
MRPINAVFHDYLEKSLALASIGIWSSGPYAPAFADDDIVAATQRFREPAHIVQHDQGAVGVAIGGDLIRESEINGVPTYPLLASLPALYPEWLGDRSFLEVHQVRYPYVQGAMANGIATARMVIAMAQAGMLGFFGAAGLQAHVVEKALDEIEAALGMNAIWGSNLIHSPHEPDLEQAVVDLYLRRGVRRVSASAYMALTPMVVQYAFTGVRRLADGTIHRDNYLFAKNSRPEVAKRFLSPPPAEMLNALVANGRLTAAEAELASQLPVAEDIIVEADSGGHTDNQALPALFPTIVAVRDECLRTYKYDRPIRLGAAGGLGSPSAVAAAFALGAAFALTGSVNQGAVESGLCEDGRLALAQAGLADVVMAPAADMFELGVKVQVLQRGTMFANRGHRLYEVYKSYRSISEIPAATKQRIEKEIFKRTLEEEWASTAAFWKMRDPRELEKANRDPHHQMALIFRSYLGQASRWAIAGVPERRMDYQIWCGPAMGAFNAWAKDSFLEAPENRTVVQIAFNMLEGAAAITRAQQLRTYGVAVPPAAFDYRPRPLAG